MEGVCVCVFVCVLGITSEYVRAAVVVVLMRGEEGGKGGLFREHTHANT